MTRKAIAAELSELHEAVRNLLNALRPFKARRGAQLENRDVAVRIVPRFLNRAVHDYCDLELKILTWGLPDDTPPQVVEGARQAYEDLLNDADPGVRAAAATALERLKAPPVSLAALDGVVVELVLKERRIQSGPCKNGRAVIRHAPAGEMCQIRYIGYSAPAAPPAGEETVADATAGEGTTHTDASSAEDTVIHLPAPGRRTGPAEQP